MHADEERPGIDERHARPARSSLALAALAFLLIACWVLRPVLRDPVRLLPTAMAPARIAQLDESMVVATVARNAHVLVNDPLALFDYGQCFPLRQSHTLGEHMFGNGVLAALPYALTGEPVLSYNVLLLLKLWIAGLAMFLFVRDLVGRDGPAFVAGVAFQLTPTHLSDLIHPYLSGDAFLPLAALFLRRLMIGGRARDAIGLALAATMLMLESFYSLVACAIVLAAYLAHLAWRHRATLAARLALLLPVGCWLALVGWILFRPYVAMHDALGVGGDGGGYLPPLQNVLRLHLLSLLAALAIADRVGGPRGEDGRRDGPGDDPRLALLGGALLALWFGTTFPPLLGVQLPSALGLLAGVVPGFDVVRAPALMGQGIWFVLAVLSAYAVLTLRPLLRGRARWAVVTTIVAAIAVERFVPAVSRRVVAAPFVPHAWEARPPDEDVRLLRATSGPILHVPVAHAGVKALVAADHLRLTSFAHRPTSACYNSLTSPLAIQVAELAAALPAPAAADALHALGFRTVLVHVEDMRPARAARFEERAAAPESGGRLRTVGRTPRLLALEIASPARTTSDEAALTAVPARAAGRTPQIVAAGTQAAIKVRVGNRAPDTFVRAAPLQTTHVAARWRRIGGGDAARARASVLLPVALGSGGSLEVAVPLDVPAQPGRYDVVVTGTRGRDLASVPVEVVEPTQSVAAR